MISRYLRAAALISISLTHRYSTRLLQMLTAQMHPRRWSNAEIARIGKGVVGDVLHVSAWRDDDKEGRKYRNYFPDARSYQTTNVGGERGQSPGGDLHLDLAAPLRPELEGQFDLVFNHTTLEHVYDVQQGLTNLFLLTRSDLVLVVPFMQVEHWEGGSYGDYWRIGAHALVQSCIENNFAVVSLSSNHNPVWPIYYCLHARRRASGDAPDHEDLWSATGASEGFGFRPVSPGHRLMQ